MGVSSTADERTVKFKPASRRISARRGEAEARMSLVEGTSRPEYYTRDWETACACGQMRDCWVSSADGEALWLMRLAWSLDDYGFLVFAEGAPQGVGNFAHCGQRFHSAQDGGEQVFGGGGAAAQFR